MEMTPAQSPESCFVCELDQEFFELVADADSENDDIQNGLALCKNAHWMFGEGLWSVQGDGRVLLAPYRFTESRPEGLRLQPYGGRLLQFADGVTLRPNTEYFARHRAFHGFRA